MKKVAILQSNYIPWKGYFDVIAAVDEFIIFDDVQYTRRDWRNRNQIKTSKGLQWLTVPVKVKGKYNQTIRDAEIDCIDWASYHWKALSRNYGRSQYFYEIAEWLKPLYIRGTFTHISPLNRKFIEAICNYLEIKTTISNSWDYNLADEKNLRLVDLCKQAGGKEYITGPSAKNYLELSMFSKMNIKVTWINYSGYLEYPQLWGNFIHEVSILDLLFNCGKEAWHYLKCVQK